jgi:hypothetical protein
MDSTRVKEIYDILKIAGDQDNVRQPIARDQPMFVNWSFAKLQDWYNTQIEYWKTMVAKQHE